MDVPGKGSQPVTSSLCQAWTTYSSRSTRLILSGYYMPPVWIVKRDKKRDSAISPLMKGATGLYSADLHKMGWAIFRKMGFSPKWEKVACDLPIFNAIHPNHPQFGHFYGLQWEVFHRRLIAQSQKILSFERCQYVFPGIQLSEWPP